MATIDELEARVPGLSEGKWYQFRIVAVNKAGESWPSYETKPHLARHKNCKFLFKSINLISSVIYLDSLQSRSVAKFAEFVSEANIASLLYLQNCAMNIL